MYLQSIESIYQSKDDDSGIHKYSISIGPKYSNKLLFETEPNVVHCLANHDYYDRLLRIVRDPCVEWCVC